MSFTESLTELVAGNRNKLLAMHPSWERVGLSDVASIQNGFPFESKFFTASTGMPLIRIRDVLDGETETYYTAEYEEEFVVQRDDLLIGMDGDFHCSLWTGRPALLNQRVCRLFPEEQFYDKRFLRYTLPGYLSSINSATSSVTVKHLSSRTVADIPLPLPPLPEQHRIVEKIEELFSDLDAGVSALQRAKVNLKRYRSSVLKSAVEGRLTEEWRKEHPQAEDGGMLLDNILRERHQKWEKDQLLKFKEKGKEPPKNWESKYEEPSAPDTSELPELPEGWVWATVGQVANDVTVGHVGSMKERYVDDGIPFLRSQNVRPLRYDRLGLRFIPTDFHEELAKSRLFGGELLVVRSGNIGEACVYPKGEPEANCSDLVITRLSDEALAEYVALFVVSPVGQASVIGKKTGSALPHFNVGAMERSPIPLPPLAEQKQIVALVEERLSQIDSAQKTIDAELIRSKRLRQSILKRAFEGNLVPQDPTDEPASVLLERIKASKETEQPKKKTKKVKAKSK